ncbi:MAG: aminoacyl-tRNA hydrolase [Gammaproteobacteria bacterium]|nr:aminoacyl-tRNA hydrolase [Gammaproteobacteria bacterium]
MTAIRLVAGLGNPGSKYEQTRHNAGFWFVDEIARQCNTQFKSESKYKSEVARCSMAGNDLRLQKPMDFMNCSGMPVASLAGFYRIPRGEVLIVHDDLDLPVGTIKLKKGGGHGGHNGLRDLIPHLGGKDFLRLRVGIGHPGDRDDVVAYVLKAPSRDDRLLIDQAINAAMKVMPDLVAGNIEAAMKELHTVK